MTTLKNNKGFTLVELMVALVVSAILIAAMYSAYTLQQRTYVAQDQIRAVQQNLRAGLGILMRELRLAGHDPQNKAENRDCNAEGTGKPVFPGIHSANSTKIGFSMDLDEDGSCSGAGENVTYYLFESPTDATITLLGRARVPSSTVADAVAENVERIEFLYTLSGGGKKLRPAASEYKDIVAVQISMLVKATQREPEYVKETIYQPISSDERAVVGDWKTKDLWDLNKGTGKAANDGFKRRLLKTTVKLRNTGI